MSKTVGDIQTAQGWNDDTLRSLMQDFISEQELTKDFIEFLENTAAEENGEEEEPRPSIQFVFRVVTDGDAFADEDMMPELARLLRKAADIVEEQDDERIVKLVKDRPEGWYLNLRDCNDQFCGGIQFRDADHGQDTPKNPHLPG